MSWCSKLRIQRFLNIDVVIQLLSAKSIQILKMSKSVLMMKRVVTETLATVWYAFKKQCNCLSMPQWSVIEIDVTALIPASLYLMYTHTHNTFSRFKKERPLVESAIYCHVLSWYCTLSCWHLPSRVWNSFAVKSNRDLTCINISFIPFTLPCLFHNKSLSWTWPGAYIW